jgi:hypothetical protein
MLTVVTNESGADHPAAPDPRALRALAHPLRWQLIDLIGSETTVTATRCAEVLGESVASCSYHLGILGKYGYIELVPDQAGKEKPWRLASQEQNLDPGDLDTEGALAAEAATGVFLDHELARIKQRLSRLSLEPEPWRAASLLLGTTTWMTAGEPRDITNQDFDGALGNRCSATRPCGRFSASSTCPHGCPARRRCARPVDEDA